MTHSQSVHTARQQPQPESFKETFESVIMAFILAFVFRAFVVEAFVIPTGSMAPTLLGQHADVTCPECGYRFSSSIPNGLNPAARAGGANSQYALALTCPMCSYPIKIKAQHDRRPGDRILVHKFIYNLVNPKRWDVVVFKFPGKPQDNFIKRLVGLPEEKLFIIDGNIYTQPLNQPNAPWKIQRKSDREIVQRTVWQPVYHSQYYPLDQGKTSVNRGTAYTWQFPWQADDEHRFKRVQRTWLAYDGQKPAALRFDFRRMLQSQLNFYGRPVGWYPYSQLQSRPQVESIEDIRIALTVEPKPHPQQALGLGITFQTTARIQDVLPVPIRATISEKGKITIATGAPLGTKNTDESQWQVRATEQIQPLPANHATKLEFWYVDQQVSVWVDHHKVLTWDFEVPLEILKRRPNPPLYPLTWVEFQGSPALITQLDLDRDLYYSSGPNRQTGALALGGLYKSGVDFQGQAVALEKDQFYCLGDNSPFSHDGRYWDIVNPWVEQRQFADKDQVTGIVPRELMIGKAFFVYFPAPHRLSATSPGLIPNFGDMRFIH